MDKTIVTQGRTTVQHQHITSHHSVHVCVFARASSSLTLMSGIKGSKVAAFFPKPTVLLFCSFNSLLYDY